MAQRTPTKTKRGRTLYALPYLMAYKREGEAMNAIRVSLSDGYRDLLTQLAKAANTAESTWFSLLAYRLLTEKALAPAMLRFAEQRFHLPPGPLHGAAKIYTIPSTLKEVIEQVSEELPLRLHDPRGVVSAFIRTALLYCAVEEKGWTVSPSLLASKPGPIPEAEVKATALKKVMRTAQSAAAVPVSCLMPKGLYEELQQVAPSLFGQTVEELLRRYISRGLRDDLLNLEMN